MIINPPPVGTSLLQGGGPIMPGWLRWFGTAQTILQNLQRYGYPQFESVVDAFAVTMSSDIGILILTPTSALNSGTIRLPADPVDRQQVQIATTDTITTLLVVTTGTATIATQPPSPMSAGQGVTYFYSASANTWYLVESPGSGSGGGGSTPTSTEITGPTFTAAATVVVPGDPGTGRMLWDNATQSSANSICFSNTSADGRSMAALWNSLPTGGYIYLQQASDSTRWQMWKWTTAPDVADPAFIEFAVTFMAGSVGGMGNTETVYSMFMPFSATLASADFANQGTTNTVLHGNAAGNPSFAQVDLTADVTGILPVPNGGTGLSSGTSGGILYFSGVTTLASSALLAASQLVLGGGAGVAPATLGSLGTATTVLHGNAAGAPSFSAVSLTADVSGILPVANGGTGVNDLSLLTANPTGTVGLTAVNGVLSTFMRSDAAPPLSQAIVPTWTGDHTFNALVLVSAGSAAAPSIAFTIDPDTGVFRTGTNGIGLSAGGVSRLQATSTAVASLVPHQFTDGSAAAPSIAFSSDLDTGVFRSAANLLGFAVAGVEHATLSTVALTKIAGTGALTSPNANYDDLTISSNVNSGLSIISGTASQGGIMFQDSADGALSGRVAYSHALDQLTLYAGGSVGLTLGAATLDTPNAITSSSTALFNSAVYGLLGVRDTGIYGGTGPNSNADAFVIEASGNTGISILTPNTVVAQIAFGDPENNIVGRVRYTHTTNILDFVVGNVDVFDMSSTEVSATVALTSDSTARFNGAVYGSLGVREGGVYGGAGPISTADGMVVEASGASGISILTPNTNSGTLRFGDPEDNDVAGINYLHSTNTMSLIAGATTVVSLLSTSVDIVPALTSGSTARFNNGPYGFLGIREGGAYGGGGPNSNVDGIVLEANGNTGLSILTPNTSIAQIRIGDSDNNAIAGFSYNHSTDVLSIVAAGVTGLTLDATEAAFSTSLLVRAQDILVGTSVAASQAWAVDILDASALALCITNSSTDAATKTAFTAIRHYTNSEEGVALVGGVITSTANTVRVGGGLSTANAATSLQFWTAATATTLTGTLRGFVDSSGNWVTHVETAAPTLATNQDMVWALTSNTNLRVSVRGTDGTTRVANITLA